MSLANFQGEEFMSIDGSCVTIPFNKWKHGEGRVSSTPPDVSTDKRCDKDSFNINCEHIKSHEENIKWESEIVFNCLNEVRKRKFFAINASMVLFPGLIGGLMAIASYLEKTGLNVVNGAGYYWVSVVSISMFIGTANMISIKYIAAYKAQANLLIRQINCLRQALDSITYYKFEGAFPIHVQDLMKGSIYYKTFGKHRKLPIGNEGFRNRLIGSFTESASL